MESHMVASQPGSGSCSKRNLWGTKFSFTSVKPKKNGEMNMEKKKQEKICYGKFPMGSEFCYVVHFQLEFKTVGHSLPGVRIVQFVPNFTSCSFFARIGLSVDHSDHSIHTPSDCPLIICNFGPNKDSLDLTVPLWKNRFTPLVTSKPFLVDR